MKTLTLVFLSVFLIASAAAQTPQKERIRRQQARSLLIALSTDARSFHDQTLRARSLARIADALWSVDAEQGRLLFRKAWEAAEVADRESDLKLQEEIRQQQEKTGRKGYAVSLPPNIRREVLRLAARRDRAIGEEFLEKMKTDKAEAATNAKLSSTRLNGDSAGQRLSLAGELLETGDIERALQFADPVLNLVTVETINFLVELREKVPLGVAAADRRYAALLSSSMANPQADANTVSLLSSYLFTPHLYTTFVGDGISTSQMSGTFTPIQVAPELRMAFFQTAASILLRPLPPPGQDQGPVGIDGKYLAIKRVLPFFELAPPEMVESLRAHLNALNTVVSENARRRDDEWLNRGVRPEKPAVEREQELMERLERAKTSTERDGIYMQLANLMARDGDMRAREFASKIEDPELRKEFSAYMDGQLANYFVQKKQPDQALEIIRKGELSHLHRTWALTRIAKFLVKTDREGAIQLIEDAAAEARRIDVSDPARPRGLVAVATALKEIDTARIWDAMFDAVKAANSSEGFTGEDGGLVLQYQSKHGTSVNTNDAPEFDLDGIFKYLASEDYDRAVELARGFEREGPRAIATISIARAVLEPPRKK